MNFTRIADSALYGVSSLQEKLDDPGSYVSACTGDADGLSGGLAGRHCSGALSWWQREKG